MFRLSSQAVLGWLTSRKSHSRNKQEPAYAPGTAFAGLQLAFQLTPVVNESLLATATRTNARSTDPGCFIMELPSEMMAHYEAASLSLAELCQLTAIQDLLCSLKSVL